ncbi:MAG: fructose-1,6-bisphosphatase [Candidatus Peribacteraceae bacterium]|nr:fructose-1,6-bisphosphatase [Candidatus Peribacteraceae bacterium]MBP9850530.1 fructose-1,6-bisphosphatase [Candidatus Peribacteraceae bacterium]
MNKTPANPPTVGYSCTLPSRVSLNQHLFTSGTPDKLRHLINDIARAGKYVENAIRTTDLGLAGSSNTFGEEQLKLDVLSNKIIKEQLCESRLVANFCSEEESESLMELVPDAPFTLVFDPLDGSSLVDCNLAIGSIFGIYEAGSPIGRTPRDQVAALYLVYGPRTILVYSAGKGAHAFFLNEVGEFVLLQRNLTISDDVKTYAPGNLRAVVDTPNYRKMMDMWMDEAHTLRYSGGMVPDIHHMLIKGAGIFTNIGGSKYPKGKLRLLFECGPFAYIMEQAGGAASDGVQAVLDITIEDLDQRTPLIIGAKTEVERVTKVLKG